MTNEIPINLEKQQNKDKYKKEKGELIIIFFMKQSALQ